LSRQAARIADQPLLLRYAFGEVGSAMSHDEIIAALAVLTWREHRSQTFAEALRGGTEQARRSHVLMIGSLYRNMLADAKSQSQSLTPSDRVEYGYRGERTPVREDVGE
jgi:hypothetical protein